MFNSEQIKRDWGLIKEGIRSVWGKIPQEEIERADGDLDKILDMIFRNTDDTNSEIESKFEQLVESYNNPSDRFGEKDVSSYERSPLIEDRLDL